MKKLILVRHSNAESGSFNKSDFSRKLTSKGITRALSQAKRLVQQNINPDLIITSTAQRAIETSDIFNNEFENKCNLQKAPFLYDDFTTSEFFKLINSVNEKYSTVLVIGHNPTISTMSYRLSSDVSASFTPCEIVIFNIADEWINIEVDGAKFINTITP